MLKDGIYTEESPTILIKILVPFLPIWISILLFLNEIYLFLVPASIFSLSKIISSLIDFLIKIFGFSSLGEVKIKIKSSIY